MANRLYPPLIEGTIPAFYNTQALVVPYSNNRSVGAGDYKGFVLKINTVRSNSCIGTVQQLGVFSLTSVTFDVSELANDLKVGQSYKIQIAYVGNDDTVGYFSTVGVIKYTSTPKVSIGGLTQGATNYTQKVYTGIYENDDTTEKVYSYQFIIRDASGEVIDDSGVLLHNSTLDESSGSSVDTYYIKHNLESNESCTVQYIVTTSGNMVIPSPRYRIVGNYTAEPQTYIRLQAILNYENGYIDLVMKGESNNGGGEVPTSGNFVLARKDLSADGRWEDIHLFVLNTELPSKHSLRDFTIWQGHTYVYSIQQYNSNGIYTDRIISNEVFADFEDAFLYDGKRQLKIRFNPKISSFKTDLLESKIDTIGGKYPFIFRNGNTYYKEFPISGLISYLSDNDQLFMTNKELALKADNYSRKETSANGSNISEFLRTTDLVGYNIAAERGFKLAVLDWLNDGEVKLFRSPGEGNYIVRLLNNSLTPTDSLGRMLHTFSSTAYEMCDFSLEALSAYGFINVTASGELSGTVIQRQKTVTLPRNATGNGGWVSALSGGETIKGFIAEDLLPGTPLRITFAKTLEQVEVYVGTTGTYAAYGLGDIGQVEIKEEYLKLIGNGDVNEINLMTVLYEEEIQSKDSFALLDSIESITNPVRTFLGPVDDNIVETLTDVKVSITKFIDLLFCLKPIEDVYGWHNPQTNKFEYYFDISKTMRLTKDTMNAYGLYRIRQIINANDIAADQVVIYENMYDEENIESVLIDTGINGIEIDQNWASNNIYYLDRNRNIYFKVEGSYIIGNTSGTVPNDEDIAPPNNKFIMPGMDYNPTFMYNGDIMDLSEIQVYEIHNVNDVKSITLGSGVYLQCAYQARQSCFSLENDDEDIKALKDAWLYEISQLNQSFINAASYGLDYADRSDQRIRNHLDLIKTAYTAFIEALKAGIEKYKREMGLDYDL